MITNTADTPAWQRLGTMLIQRRVALDPRYRNRRLFADEARLDYRLIYDIEESRRTNFGSATLAAIESAYRLAPGAIARVLAGGELEPQPAPPRPQPPAPPAIVPASLEQNDDAFPAVDEIIRPAVDREYADIEPLVLQAMADYPETVITGAHVFPAGGDDERNWDSFTDLGWSLWQRAMGVAVTRAIREHRASRGGSAAGLRRA